MPQFTRITAALCAFCILLLHVPLAWTRQPEDAISFSVSGVPAPAEVKTVLAQRGTILDPAHGYGAIPDEGFLSDAPLFRDKAILVDRSFVITVPKPPTPIPGSPSKLPAETKRNILSEIEASRITADSTTRVNVRFYGEDGMIDTSARAMELDARAIGKLRSSVSAKGRLPRGGMVYLAGGKFHFRGSHNAVASGILTLCEGTVCIDTEGTSGMPSRIRTGIPADIILAELWRLVFSEGVDTLYLSINPTKAALAGNDGRENTLVLKTSTDKRSEFANEVVVTEQLRVSRAGKVLFDADVAFKSAALGFDVLRGRSSVRPGPEVQLQLRETTLEPVAFDYEIPRYCRYYWASKEQEVYLDGNRMRFRGAPVVARSEAMVVDGGTLASYPKGRWCEGGKRLARDLSWQVAHPRGGASKALSDLRELGQAHNFLVWARSADVVFDADLSKHLSTLLAADQPPTVPRWTSGISDNIGVLFLRADLRHKDGQQVFALHSHSADGELQLQVAERWDVWNAKMMKDHFDLIDGVYTGKTTDTFATYERELMTFTRLLAKELRAHYLPALIGTVKGGTTTLDLVPLPPSEKGQTNVVQHALPLSVHGGVLLQAWSSLARAESDRLKRNEALPDGRPFLAFEPEGKIHIWAMRPADTAASRPVGEHLTIENARIVDRYAEAGRIRFLVKKASPKKTGKGVVMWLEKRFEETKEVPGGLEWRRRLPLSGPDEERNYASWKTLAGEFVRPDASTDWKKLRDIPKYIEVIPVSDDEWMVDVELPGVVADVEKRWRTAAKERSVSKGLAGLRALKDWGALQHLEERSQELRSWVSEDSEDSLLRDSFFPHGVAPVDGLARLSTEEVREMIVGLASMSPSRGTAKQVDIVLAPLIRMLPRRDSAEAELLLAELYESWSDRAGRGRKLRQELARRAGAHRQLATRDKQMTELQQSTGAL